jgi:hypothetical protein
VTNASGNLTASFIATARTEFRAVFKGDSQTAAAETRTTVWTRATTGATQQGFYARSGDYRIYRSDAQASITAAVVPKLSGDLACVHAQIKLSASSDWEYYYVPDACRTLDSNGVATINFGFSRVNSPLYYRLFVVYAGDDAYQPASSIWLYLESN